jgi:serine/threonine-protein kinase HipA
MPLQQRSYDDAHIRVVLGGWIPDRRETLQRLADEFHVAPTNPFDILGIVGEDCPGAVQFARPERIESIRESRGRIAWLTEAELAERLRRLRTSAAPERLRGDKGRFSLPGQMPKTALVFERDDTSAGGRWGVPEDGYPTTHILKPPLGGDAKYLAAEHLSLRLAEAVGLRAAETFVVHVEDQIALGVTRFDRVPIDDGWLRVHQEDLCQSLGWSPDLKFESHGGPGIKTIVTFLRERSNSPVEDVNRFLQAIALNWVLIGTDAHARNYSMLIGAGGSARLSPLYDVSSGAAIAESRDIRTLDLTMQIGGVYNAEHIRRNEWRMLATELGIPPSEIEATIGPFVASIANATAVVAGNAREEGSLPPEIIETFERRVEKRARRCARFLGA